MEFWSHDFKDGNLYSVSFNERPGEDLAPEECCPENIGNGYCGQKLERSHLGRTHPWNPDKGITSPDGLESKVFINVGKGPSSSDGDMRTLSSSFHTLESRVWRTLAKDELVTESDSIRMKICLLQIIKVIIFYVITWLGLHILVMSIF